MLILLLTKRMMGTVIATRQYLATVMVVFLFFCGTKISRSLGRTIFPAPVSDLDLLVSICFDKIPFEMVFV